MMNKQGKKASLTSVTTTALQMVIVLSLAVQALMQPDNAMAQCDSEEKAKLLASDAVARDWFGSSVSISGDGALAVVGAPGRRIDHDRVGKACVFRLSGAEWVEEATLRPSYGANGDQFGFSVAISSDGGRAIIGAPGDDAKGDQSGSAYVYRFSGSEWIEESKLLAPDGDWREQFGYAISINEDGTRAVIGAHEDDDNGSKSGSAYVFRFNGSEWIEEAKLLASDGEWHEHFGNSVSINSEGTVVIIGAFEDDGSQVDTGSAYIFRFNGSEWVEEAKLVASDGAKEDRFGACVAIDGTGEKCIVGALFDDDNGTDSGSVYAYRFNGLKWNEEEKLLSSDGRAYQGFGGSVSISEDGSMAIVGAHLDDENGNVAGAAYLLRQNGAIWIEDSKLLASDGGVGDQFGNSVSINADGTMAMIGARWDDIELDSGSAYIFQMNCAEPCLTLEVDDLFAGLPASFIITGGIPGARAVTVAGTHTGETIIRGREAYCATFGIRGLNQSSVLGGFRQTFDANGEIDFAIPVPFGARGRTFYFQSAMRGTCPNECTSMLVTRTVW